MYGSYLQMLDPVHNQSLRICLGAFRTSPEESLYVDAHEPGLGGAKLSLPCVSKIKSLPKHPTHDAVFDNKHMGYSFSVVCAIVFPSDTINSMRLPDSASIFTAEIWTIIKVLEFFLFCCIQIHCLLV